MPDIKIPTLDQFKAQTGRSGVSRVFKKKNDFADIYKSLRNGVNSAAEARALRRACMAWLDQDPEKRRVSNAAVGDLLVRANSRFVAFQEFANLGKQADSGKKVDIQAKPMLPFGKELTGKDVGRIGNQMNAGLSAEMQSRHWGPNTTRALDPLYQAYKAGGGLLSIGAWADYIHLPNTEDDPEGKHLVKKGAPTGAKVIEGVKYCTAEERKAYSLSFQGGLLIDRNGELYDTTARETHFSKYGWAIFVLGFDNTLYSNTHHVDLFHHSSFFAGNPVQCGGEICCIGGKIRYLTNKTGHYRSSPMEFYRLLSFMSYHGVDLSNVLSCNDVSAGKFFRAADMFGAHGKDPSGPAILPKRPQELKQPGVPPWPIPPMSA